MLAEYAAVLSEVAARVLQYTASTAAPFMPALPDPAAETCNEPLF